MLDTQNELCVCKNPDSALSVRQPRPIETITLVMVTVRAYKRGPVCH